jgi:hypothetical protein
MKPEEKRELTDAVVAAVLTAQKQSHEEHREYFVDREEHYQHHQFINSWIKFMDVGRKTALRTFIAFMVMTILGLLVFGFWEKIAHVVGK